MATLMRPGTSTDAEVQQRVMHELRWDTRVSHAAAEIGVAVHGGVVTLSGEVGSFAEKVAAERAAHRVAGVLDVAAGELHVHYPRARGGTSDADIGQAVRHALEWDVFVPHEGIHSTVADGFVTLSGSVPLWRHREDAERAIRNLSGVRGVHNQIAVAPQQGGDARSAAALRDAIEAALERRAERQAARTADRIGVRVENGVVTLDGTVATWAERRAILGVVGHAPGVRAVEDRLRIQPFL